MNKSTYRKHRTREQILWKNYNTIFRCLLAKLLASDLFTAAQFKRIVINFCVWVISPRVENDSLKKRDLYFVNCKYWWVTANLSLSIKGEERSSWFLLRANTCWTCLKHLMNLAEKQKCVFLGFWNAARSCIKKNKVKKWILIGLGLLFTKRKKVCTKTDFARNTKVAYIH